MQLTTVTQIRSWQAQTALFLSKLVAIHDRPVAMATKKVRDMHHLKELPEYLLDDVGLQRSQIEPAVSTGQVNH